MMPRRPLLFAAALSALALAPACGIALSMKAEARDQWKRSYTLKEGGSVEIKNANGRIDIQPGDGNVVEVVADRVARAGSDEGARDALKRIEITESISPDRIALESTKSGMGIEMNVSRHVDYTVHVPRWAKVTLNSTNGEIVVAGVTGDVKAVTTNGNISARDLEGRVTVDTTNGAATLELSKIGADGVSCQTTNGSIELTLPRSAQARLSVRVSNGSIDVEGLDLKSTENSRKNLEATIGGGGPPVKLETTNGGVHVRGR